MSQSINFNVFLTKWCPETIGYERKTTFWDDFCIAEVIGKDDPSKGLSAIKDTYHHAFDEWKNNTEYITELVLVLSHKIWFWYDIYQKTVDPKLRSYADQLSTLYNELWMNTDEWCLDHLKGKDMDYYFKTTD